MKFLVSLPKKVTFDFLGCFKMELRAIGFYPEADVFSVPSPAMSLSGQLKFAVEGGDVVSTKIDLHNLYIGLPKPGEFFPQVHLKKLAVLIRSGNTFYSQLPRGRV